MAFFDVDQFRRAIVDRLGFYQSISPPTPESVDAIATLVALLAQLPQP